MTEELRLERSTGAAGKAEAARQDWSIGPEARAAGELALGAFISLTVLFILSFNIVNGGGTPGTASADVFLIFLAGLLTLPGLRLVLSGVGELMKAENSLRDARRAARRLDKRAEQQLLEVIGRRGEATPALIAVETSLTVAEADAKLRELAEGGYVEVRARDGRLFYSL